MVIWASTRPKKAALSVCASPTSTRFNRPNEKAGALRDHRERLPSEYDPPDRGDSPTGRLYNEQERRLFLALITRPLGIERERRVAKLAAPPTTSGEAPS
jgi:hypothetical protein